MDDMRKEAEREARTMWEFICTFLKWLIIAGVTGGIGGLVGSAFHLSVNWAATFRAAHPWLLWLLPVGGLLIAAIYRLTKMENKNTNAIIDAIHFGDKGAAAARAGDLSVDRHHASVRRQRRSRGRGAADRRQPRLLHRAAVPS